MPDYKRWQLRAQIEETASDYDREKLQERLAKLAGGVAVIKVGAATETEMKDGRELKRWHRRFFTHRFVLFPQTPGQHELSFVRNALAIPIP